MSIAKRVSTFITVLGFLFIMNAIPLNFKIIYILLLFEILFLDEKDTYVFVIGS